MFDLRSRIIRESTAKSKDGRIDQNDFLNYAASSSRYSLFTPMEASIIFHFAGRGVGMQRLALLDFAQLLDPRWRPPHDEEYTAIKAPAVSWGTKILMSSYSFVQGGRHNSQISQGGCMTWMSIGFAGAVGATIVYPIDMVKVSFSIRSALECLSL